VQNTRFSTNKTLNINGRLVDLRLPRIMGILNVTPDSFFDGGRFLSEHAILLQTERMLAEGADFIDVGGYSSRPGAGDVSEAEEITRTVSAISSIARAFPGTAISVDTFRSAVAKAAVEAGASLVNDISGGNLDPRMLETVSSMKVPYILMHMKGDPRTMSSQTEYKHLLTDVIDYIHAKIALLKALQVKDIIIDPGFGFAKSIDQNFVLLNNLEKFSILGRPIMVGLSRKSTIWKTLAVQPEAALNGTTALHAIALLKGADILRVHDVKEAKEVVKLFTSLQVEPGL
jgi:dihydropteroate synthase